MIKTTKLTTTTMTIAQQIADCFVNDGMTWRLVGGFRLVDLCDEQGTRSKVEVTGSGQTWTITAWTFADGSQIGEVTEGGWDILDQYLRTGDLIDLDHKA